MGKRIEEIEERMRTIERGIEELKEKIREKRDERRSQSSNSRSMSEYSDMFSRSRYEDSIISRRGGSAWSLEGKSEGLNGREISTLKKVDEGKEEGREEK